MSTFMIQSSFGPKGNNFEIVGPAAPGGFFHGVRNNETSSFLWNVNFSPFYSQHEIRGISLVQSTFGNLEAIALVLVRPPSGPGPTNPLPYYALVHYYRDSAGVWNDTGELAPAGDLRDPLLNVFLPPAFIQSRGTPGNFEVVVALEQGGLAHCWRNNEIPGFPWSALSPLGTNRERFEAVALIQSSFGNLEVVARTGSRLVHFWRDAALNWHEPQTGMDQFFSGAAGSPGFVQSRFGAKNFELVTPLETGGLRHLYRDNKQPGLFPWVETETFATADVVNGGRVSLIQSSFGTPDLGNLEVAVLQDRRFLHYFRLDSGSMPWSSPPAIEATP